MRLPLPQRCFSFPQMGETTYQRDKERGGQEEGAEEDERRRGRVEMREEKEGEERRVEERKKKRRGDPSGLGCGVCES